MFSDSSQKKKKVGDVVFLASVSLVMLIAFTYVTIRLLDQSEKHVDDVKNVKVKYQAFNEFAPQASESEALIQRDLRKNPNRETARYTQVELTEPGLRMIGRMHKLKELDLSDCSFDEDWLKYLVSLRLERFYLSSTSLSSGGLKYIAQIKSIEYLNLESARINNEDLQLLGGLERLSSLNLRGTKVDDEAMVTLLKCTRIADLNLGYTHVSDRCCETLGKMPSLFSVTMDGTEVTGQGLAKLRQVASLRCRYCQLTDRDVEAIADLPVLYRLDLVGNQIGRRGLMALKMTPKLTSLVLTTSQQITQSDVKKFIASKPGCNISLEAPSSPMQE